MSKDKLHRVYFIIIVVWLITPLSIVLVNNYLPEIYIAGVEEESESEPTSWLDGTRQKEIENELFENTTLKALMIRIRNQYQYSLFHKINAQQVYEFDNYFYRFYINNYREDLYVNSDETNNKILSDLIEFKSLIRKDCPIISIIAPSKARYYPDYLPERNITRSKNTNYDFFKKGLAENGITCLDFNDYFVSNKGKFDAAIIAKGGIHWTYYATAIAMDSLVKTVESLKGVKYNHFSSTLQDGGGFNVDDQDLSVLCNLLVRKYDPKIKLVEFKQNGASRKKINALIIGDSFFYTVEHSELRKLIFTENSDYLYYFEKTHNAYREKSPIDIEKIKKQLQEVDCIIFLNDLVNMEKFTFGFPSKMLEVLKNDSAQKRVKLK